MTTLFSFLFRIVWGDGVSCWWKTCNNGGGWQIEIFQKNLHFRKLTAQSVGYIYMINKKDQIIAVATQLFAERGFENTPVSLICETAGVSKGLVFHHFKSKQELLREIFTRTTELIKDINATDSNNATPQERLKDRLDSFFAGLAANKMLFQFNLNMMLQPRTRSILQDLIDKRAAFLLQSVKALFDAIDAENSLVLSYAFIAELDGIALHYFSIYKDYPLADIQTHLLKKYS